MCPHCGGEHGKTIQEDFVQCVDCNRVVNVSDWDMPEDDY